ncbi:MAG: alpha-mannosidase, partial [Candidatus Hydrogenedentes bacterium]|nr:alpha-mannosidase [Candidatus Hydrogenedentota bacterium]
THVDWHEKRRFLKVAFPVDVLSAKAAYHIQFAAIERSTHKNTAFDHARFEVTGHHWADLSEAEYGVSLLNDCKYGYDVHDNVLRLSLLRSPIDPDPHADEGEHRFTYALLPHEGNWHNSTVREGYALNAPLFASTAKAAPGTLPPSKIFAETDKANVIVETVKQAEDSDALIVRVYEAHGARGTVHIRFGMPLSKVTECNLMEDPETEVPVEKNNSITLQIKPFEVRSFLVEIK